MSGREIEMGLKEMGITPAELHRLTGIAHHTLAKVFKGEHVRDTTFNRVLNEYKRLKALRGTPVTSEVSG